MLNSNNIKYSTLTDVDAQSTDNEKKIQEIINENNNINFVSFNEGTVTRDSTNNKMGGSEHMASFDYAYKLENVRDWLLKQHK